MSGEPRKPEAGVEVRSRTASSRKIKPIVTIDDLLAKKVSKSRKDVRSDMTTLEAIVLQLLHKSLAGDKRAMAVLLRFRSENPNRVNPQFVVSGELPPRWSEREYNMTDYEIGYRKPPRQHQFKKGVCPNPKGRGKAEDWSVGSAARAALDELVEVTEGGKTIRMRRFDILIRNCIAQAVRGDVKSAEMLLALRAHVKSHKLEDPILIQIIGGLPDSGPDPS